MAGEHGARQRAFDAAIAQVERAFGKAATAERKQPGWVYIVASADGRMVKAGYSRNPERRLKNLQSSCPLKLRIVSKHRSNPFAERMLHEKWQKWRLHGEWYEGTSELWHKIACRDFAMRRWAENGGAPRKVYQCEKGAVPCTQI